MPDWPVLWATLLPWNTLAQVGLLFTLDSLLESEVFTSTSDEDSTLLPEEAPTHMCELPSRYVIPKTNEEIKRAHEESVPKATRTDTAYCIRLRNDWAENRSKHTKEMVPPFDQLHDKSLLQCWLTRFVLEVRSKKRTENTLNTLHHIVCGIMRHLQQNCNRPEIDFFKDPDLLISVLHWMLKRRDSKLQV